MPIASNELHSQQDVPNSPPPSFRSRASSRRTSLQNNQTESESERSLADAFAGGSDDESDNEEDDRSRLVSGPAARRNASQPDNTQRRVTEIAHFMPSSEGSRRVYGGGNSSTRDGVFANISAKPTREEETEEKPPVRARIHMVTADNR